MKVEVQRFSFVTWPRGRCVTWICRWGPLILSHHPAKFGVHRPYENGNITFFICHVTAILKSHVTLCVYWEVTNPLCLGSIGLVKVGIQRFWFVTWPHGRCVTWRCRWGPLILTHHFGKFGVHRSSEGGDITFLFVTWPRYRSVTWLGGWGPLILSHHRDRFGVYRPYVTENNSVCSISSNSNSNAEVYK